jgi:two-component system, sensor histidine kinase
VRQSLKRVLEFEGFRVLAVGGADEALASIQCGDTLDVIVCEYRLAAGQTGIDLVGSLRTRLGTATPTVVLTGGVEPMSELMHGNMRFLRKPIDAEALTRTIGELARPANAN